MINRFIVLSPLTLLAINSDCRRFDEDPNAIRSGINSSLCIQLGFVRFHGPLCSPHPLLQQLTPKVFP
jgi:hypothetical protein